MRYLLAVLLSLSPLSSAVAQLSIQFSLPSVSIGIDMPVYPELVQVPGYPVYYAPAGDTNFFFYDGLYWVYQRDGWYASSWYNGPWGLVDPQEVPLFVLRVPVRYYRQPPAYFRGWREDAPPRWGEHWGGDWERRHGGWDQWNHQSAPPPAPLPSYQKAYAGSRYPPPERQQELRGKNYRYQPHDPIVKRATEAPAPRGGPPAQREATPPQRTRQEPVQPPKGRPPVQAAPSPPAARPQPAQAPAPQSRPQARPEQSTAHQQGQAGPPQGNPRQGQAGPPQGSPRQGQAGPPQGKPRQGEGQAGPAEQKHEQGQGRGEERGPEHAR